MSETLADDVVTRLSSAADAASVRAALSGRADVMEMTQATHDAALMPADPGGLSHGLRAALAVRIARLNEDEALAAHYARLLENAGASADEAAAADPDFKGGGRLAAAIAFTDLVTMRTRETTAADIEALRKVGISDADIVRLAELNAFLAYQVRVIAGLKLMRATA
ncbi:CMD domain-containing protein [Chelativorans salis]|uniref:Carboxymuconolactone decarboxylase family protein n=1 Tax=Chelativorans salis TaxID=2978478 RepID=A0ABT2LLQ6_9HYPH|nr:carboxymuconolactone decarboxylase family protein [Chelativorans sp. EGI FJ00035]MCT7374593.1 carboxymuconolactone decarboxylase family protein [Chelativorans sp. EGI FJ00035]